MSKATNLKPRLAVLQFGDPDGALQRIDYEQNGLREATLVSEPASLDVAAHKKRAVEVARALPAGSFITINAEHYGAKNLAVACDIVSAVAKAGPSLWISAYLPEQTVGVQEAIGWAPSSRSARVASAVRAARSLRDAGASFASIDAYARLDGKTGEGVRQYLYPDPFSCWTSQVGEAAAAVESILWPGLWITNRMHPNGVKLEPVSKPDGSPDNLSNLEPFVTPEEFMKMFLFAEHRGWGSISLLGWSATLRERTKKGFLPFLDRDRQDIANLKSIARPT